MTINREITVEGIGLHTGTPSVVTLLPTSPGSGIEFRLASGAIIPAIATNVVDTSRCTVLGTVGGQRVSTVEHLLSACSGLGISDLTIKIDGLEMPIGDGSALFWTEALLQAGVTAYSTGQEGTFDSLNEEIVVTGSGGAFIAAYPSETPRLTVAISFPHPLVGTQIARFEPSTPEFYRSEVAGARTFGFIEEVEALRAAGLALGGTLDNAIVIYPDRYSSALRFDNELARHKLLDLMGDLLLSGSSKLPNADIIAVKPSHRLNVELAARLLAKRDGRHSYEG